MNLQRVKAVVERELLKRRIAVVMAADKTAEVRGPNHSHAAAAVLRAARLTSVGNWLADKLQTRLALLESQLAKDILAHAKGWGEAALPSLFQVFDSQVASTFDWLRGEVADDLQQLSDALHLHAVTAARRHFIPGTPPSPGQAGPDASSALVLGAPPSDHLDKFQADLLFRLKAAVRQAVAAGSTAQETVTGLDCRVAAR